MEFKNLLTTKQMESRATPIEDDVRGPYFRDQTAIIHSRRFRRLSHKTQLIYDPSNDHLCTRMEHSLHVASIAESICENLGLDSALAEAIGYGHDVGHTPFGHIGEKVIGDLQGKEFYHSINSLRVVDKLENFGKGLNLTFAVRDGIVAHSGKKNQSIKIAEKPNDLDSLVRPPQSPSTWEGCVAKMSDDIAYLGRDIEDAALATMITLDEIPQKIRGIFGDSIFEYNRQIVKMMVADILATSQKTGEISLSNQKFELVIELKDFIARCIDNSPVMGVWNDYVTLVLKTLFDYFGELFSRFNYYFEQYETSIYEIHRAFGHHLRNQYVHYQEDRVTSEEIVADYLTGMTDRFALECFRRVLYDGSSGFR